MTEPRVYRSWRNVLAVVIIFALCGVFAVDAVIREGWSGCAWVLVLSAAVWIGWVVFLSPRVVVCDEGIDVHNGLRVWHLPWRSIAEIRVNYRIEARLVTGRRVILRGAPDRIRPTRGSMVRQEPGRGPRVLEFAEELERRRVPAVGDAESTVGWDSRLLLSGAGVALAAVAGVFWLVA